jgi:peptide deformylase
MELIPDSDPRLHSKAERFNPRNWDELGATIDAMFEIMKTHDGMGLAAPQVGIMKRLFIMQGGLGKKYVCINPKVTKISKETRLKDEGCLSYPNQKYMVTRAIDIRVSFQDAKGNNVTKKFTGTMARCFLHELDHLNGVVMSDVGTLMDDNPL